MLLQVVIQTEFIWIVYKRVVEKRKRMEQKRKCGNQTIISKLRIIKYFYYYSYFLIRIS